MIKVSVTSSRAATDRTSYCLRQDTADPFEPITGAVTIPATNPFYGFAMLEQRIWVNGLRNPFRCSFDGPTGRLFIGDVGQDSREEIDVQPAPSNLIKKEMLSRQARRTMSGGCAKERNKLQQAA